VETEAGVAVAVADKPVVDWNESFLCEQTVDTHVSILLSQSGDTAVVTYSTDLVDYKFEVWGEGSTAFVEYQESQIGRGRIEVSDPDESVYRRVIQSDKLTKFLNRNGYSTTKKVRPGDRSTPI